MEHHHFDCAALWDDVHHRLSASIHSKSLTSLNTLHSKMNGGEASSSVALQAVTVLSHVPYKSFEAHQRASSA